MASACRQASGALRPGSVLLRLCEESLQVCGARPHQGRAHAGKEPQAGQLRPVPAVAACDEAGEMLTIWRRRADMVALAFFHRRVVPLGERLRQRLVSKHQAFTHGHGSRFMV
jgi:hypothetical protein